MRPALLVLLLALLFLLPAFHAGAQADEGEKIFKAQCSSCHSVHAQVVGPALSGVDQRRDINWITQFVKSSQTVIKSGDPYATALFNKFNKMVMPDHPDMTDDQVKSIVAYIQQESKNAPVVKLPFPKPTPIMAHYSPITLKDTGYIAMYLVLLVMLVLALYFAVRVKEVGRAGSEEPAP